MITITIAGQIIAADIVRLELCGKNIHDLTSLQKLTNIKYLALEENQITDITPLYSLINLIKLELGGNPLMESQIDELRRVLPSCEIIL